MVIEGESPFFRGNSFGGGEINKKIKVMKANSHNLESDKLQGKNNKTIGYKQVKDVPKLHKPTAEIEKILLSAVPLKIDVTERLLPPKVAWELSNIKTPGFTTLGTLGNFSLVTGKAKSRKSFFVSIAVGAAVGNKLVLERFRSDLPPKKNNVLYFDTEQGRYHVHLAMCRICKLIGIPTPPNLHVYSLRSKTPAEKLEIIEALIYNNPTIGFVVIDGIKGSYFIHSGK